MNDSAWPQAPNGLAYPSPRPVPYQASMQRAFGADFSGVRAELGSPDAPTNGAVAQPEHIAFGPANPSPWLVAHELAHVVQFRNAGTFRHRDAGRPRSADRAAEAEANASADHVVSGGSASPTQAPASTPLFSDGDGPLPPEADLNPPGESTLETVDWVITQVDTYLPSALRPDELDFIIEDMRPFVVAFDECVDNPGGFESGLKEFVDAKVRLDGPLY